MADTRRSAWQSDVWGNIGQTARDLATEGIANNGFQFVPGSLENATFLKSQGMPTGTSTVTASDGTITATPEVQAMAKSIVENPDAALAAAAPPDGGGIIDSGKRILGSLFNAEDEADWKIGPVGLAPVESAWDGFLRGMGWTYNSISQLTAAGLSGLPGGIPTLTWDEAYNVSVGQVGYANAAIGLQDMQEGNILGGLAGYASGGVLNTAAASFQETFGDKNAAIDAEGFDIRDPAQRKAIFEDNALNKWSTGLTDTAFTLAADPLIVGGKILKVARLRYIDRPLTPENVTTIQKELRDGEALSAAGDVDQMAPIARLLHEAITPDATTGKRPTMREIETRGEISFSGDSYGIAYLLSTIPAGNYEQGRLIMEAGLGIGESIIKLKTLYAQSADTLLNAQRAKLENEFLSNPQKQADLIQQAEQNAVVKEEIYRAIEKANKQGKTVDPIQEDFALKELNSALEVYQSFLNGKIPADRWGPAALQWNEKVLDDAIKNNVWLRRAVDESQPILGAFAASDRGFATNTRIGRAVSARRAKAAKASYETKASIRSGWRSEDFFGNSKFVNTIRVWRKLGVENSTYYFNTTASGASDGLKGLAAMFDGLRMYSGAAKDFVVTTAAKTDTATGKTFGEISANIAKSSGNVTKTTPENLGAAAQVGGVERKEQLISMFAQTMGETHNTQIALAKIEQEIQNDLMKYYGVNQEIAEYIFKTMTGERERLNNVIITRHYYPDGVDGISEIISKNAFLESQLLQGTYMLPFDEVEKVFMNVASGKIGDPRVGALLTAPQEIKGKLNDAYEVFNDLWRPAVLFRLGYPQRNVSEGVFRSIMFNQSLAPLGWAAKAATKAPANFKRVERAEKQRGKIETQLAVPDAARDTFDSVIATRANLRRDNRELIRLRYMLEAKIAKTGNLKEEIVNEATGEIFNMRQLDDAKRALNTAYAKADSDFQALGVRPVPAGMVGTKFQTWRELQVKEITEEANQNIQFVDDMIELNGGLDSMSVGDQSTVWILRQLSDELKEKAIRFDRDDVYSLNEYTNQAAARRVVDVGGPTPTASGRVINSAFGNPRYRDLALSELSSNDTIKAIMTLKVDLQQSIFYKKIMEMRVDVVPSDGAAYWEGMAGMLRQYSQSEVGKKILAGESAEDIAIWLLTDTKGISVRESLFKISSNPGDPKKSVSWEAQIGNTIESATNWAEIVIDSFDNIVKGNNKVIDILKTRPASAEELQNLYPLDVWGTRLGPVVGDKSQIVGLDSVKEIYTKWTAKAFDWIGTRPEDAFVRIPFYAARYDDTKNILVRNFEAQYPKDRIPIALIGQIEVAAHKRALKDTKDFLYTIDRRTMLGRYGEYVSPFISATQNSVTSLARLTRRDPALPGMMLALWNAPNKLGWEDENGKLIIPLPKGLIPDGLEDFFGLDAVRNMTISKSSLNVIFPESGFGFVPRLNPLAQVGASELMKQGLFGNFAIEAPPILVNSFGKKDADNIWAVFKEYLYGEEQGVSSETLSWDKVTPPAAKKIFDLVRGDSSSTYAYQYALQARSEDLLWQGGYRDDYPTAAEITDRTNGQFWLRFIGNMTAFTPPEYTTLVQPVIDMQRRYDDAYQLEGPMMFSQTYGNELLTWGSTDTTKNVGGVVTTADAVRNIRKHEALIERVAPMAKDDPSVLGILVNSDDPEAAYDASALRWLQDSTIPGLSRNWRELVSGPEALNESQRQAGWVEYTKFMGQLDAMLENAGLANYQLAAARPLNNMRKAFIDDMMNNPNYYAWSIDYKNAGSTKTVSAVNVITEALKNEKFMTDRQGDLTWVQANNYIGARNEVIAAVIASGKPLSNEINDGLRAEWDSFRQILINRDIGWGNIANRYLTGDDNPDIIPVSFNQEVYSG